MPDPICSAKPSPLPAFQDPDPLLGGCSSATSQSQAEAARGVDQPVHARKAEAAAPHAVPTELRPAVQSLVASGSRPSAAAQFVENQKPTANTTAERIGQSPVRTFDYDRGVTADGSRYEIAGLLYGHDAATGLSGEYGVVATQKGRQNEVQFTGARAGIQSRSGDALSVEALTAQAGSGIHNKDGSTGGNVSVGATLVGAEGTVNLGGNSVTLGASLGATLETSVGTRDGDHDGNTEYCFRVAIPVFPISGGACVEVPKDLVR